MWLLPIPPPNELGLADYRSILGHSQDTRTAVEEYLGMKGLEKELREKFRQTEWYVMIG